MGLSLLGFVAVQLLALGAARGGGARLLRRRLAALGSPAGRSEAEVFAALGAPLQLRRATPDEADADVTIAEWAEGGARGGWHIALAFAGATCLGLAARNFQPLAPAA